MNPETSEYQDLMLNEFRYRKGANPSYSLRSFARDLGLSPSRLSEILTRKGDLSPEKAGHVAIKLGLKNKEIGLFRSLVILKSKVSTENEKRLAEEFLQQTEHAGSFRILDESTFSLIAEPEHLEILVAMELKDFDGSILWLEKNLRIEGKKIEECLQRLLKAGLISKAAESYIPHHEYVTTTHGIPSKALRLSHKLTLKKAIDSLDEIALEFRDITSMTMAIDIEKLPEAKQMIKDFRRNLSHLLTTSEKRSHVYNINVQLYPISKVES